MFELQCLVLCKDFKMYKDCIEVILLQMEEVVIEWDQVIVIWEELYLQYVWGLQEKDVLCKQVWELGEKVDELQLQVFQCEVQLLVMEGRFRWQQLEMFVLSFDLEDGLFRSFQEFLFFQDLEDIQFLNKGEVGMIVYLEVFWLF